MIRGLGDGGSCRFFVAAVGEGAWVNDETSQFEGVAAFQFDDECID